MKEILVLCTAWSDNYWESDKVAPYPKKSIEAVKHLKSTLPMPGIGVYIKQKGKDFTHKSPCFLIIKNIDENDKGEPQFDFHFIRKMEGITSSQLIHEIEKPDLFFAISHMKILNALDKFRIEPPYAWSALLGERKIPMWQDWIGERFLGISKTISNNEYEDRVAEIFHALGFEIEQMGHKKEGEYPDGVIYSKEFAVVYDCKNRSGYLLNAADKRAMTKYIQDAKRRINERRGIEKVFFTFIAHSYLDIKNLSEIEKETSTKGMALTSEVLLYLLFKKLLLGSSFLLTDFERLISGQVITKEGIGNIYSGE